MSDPAKPTNQPTLIEALRAAASAEIRLGRSHWQPVIDALDAEDRARAGDDRARAGDDGDDQDRDQPPPPAPAPAGGGTVQIVDRTRGPRSRA